MEGVEEIPAKRRKVEDFSTQNGGAKTRNDGSPLNLQIKPQALARLRQIAKNTNITLKSPNKQISKDDVQITTTTKSNDDIAITLATKDTNGLETTKTTVNENNAGVQAAKDLSDVIISSAGSSPAHSPKPEDLTVLSTPPKIAWGKDKTLNPKEVSKHLLDQLEKIKERREPNAETKQPNKETTIDVRTGNEKTGEDNTTSQAVGPLNVDSLEFKKVLKSMIDEKFKQVEDSYQNQDSEKLLTERIVHLEGENRTLHEYAAKLEKAVKLLLEIQKNKKDRPSKSAQTDLVFLKANIVKSPSQPQNNVVNVSPPGQKAIHPKPAMSALNHQVNQQATQLPLLLTATQAAIPGHSIAPASLPQRAYPQQIQLTSPTLQQAQISRPPPQYPSNVSTQLATSPIRRPAPVTVTVHPQTSNTTILPTPSYPTPKTTYVTNTSLNQPRPPVAIPQIRPHGSQPMLIYQKPPAPQVVQNVQQFSNPAVVRSPVVQPAQQQIQSINRPPILPQNSFNLTRPQVSPTITSAPRNPTIVNKDQIVTNPQSKELPGRPVVSIAVVSNGIVLSWNMTNSTSTSKISRYQLFALQDSPKSQWKKIGVVNALPLPMACTLTQFLPGNKYHFTVRAQDEQGRCGPLSEPCTVTLK